MANEHYNNLTETTYRICSYYEENHIDYLRQAIGKLLICVSDGVKWEKETKKLSLKKLIKLLDGFIDDAYLTLFQHEKRGFTHYNAGHIIKEPCIIGCKCLEFGEQQDYLKKIKAFQGEIILLNKKETSNFYLPLSEFFTFDSLVGWKSKLKEWQEHAVRGISIHEDGVFEFDKTAQTYFQLLKLIEVCNIINKCRNHNFGISIRMLFESDQMPFFLDPYGVINPFEEFNAFFANENAHSLKSKLSSWILAATTEGKLWDDEEPGHLVEFHKRMQTILEICWILYDSQYLLEEWIDINNFETLHPCKAEPSENFHPDNSELSNEQLENPMLFIDNALFDSGVTYERNVLQNLLLCALSKDKVAEKLEWPHQKLYMMIDALYILNVKICKKRNAPIKE